MKIQELTEKIYQDGIEKVRQEERVILDNARKEGNALIESAKKEAESIVRNAQNEATQVKGKLESEMKIASNQALSLLKQQIADLLSQAALGSTVGQAVKDVEFIKSVIQTIVAKWNLSQTNLDLTIVLPEEQKEEFLKLFKSKAGEILGKGVELKFQGRMGGGFVIGPSDNSYKLSFSEKDFIQFFKSFLRQKTKEILFPGNSV